MTAHGTHRSYMLDMAHSIPSVDQAKSRQAPWPAEHASPRVMRVALVTLKVVLVIGSASVPSHVRQTSGLPTQRPYDAEHEAHQDGQPHAAPRICQKADCIPKSMARHPSRD